MPQPTLQEIFKEVKTYIGRAIQVCRVAKGKTKEELWQILKDRFGTELDIEAIEKEEAEISFLPFQQICIILGYSVETALGCAKNIMENDGRPDSELREEILGEIKYELWRRQQEGQ